MTRQLYVSACLIVRDEAQHLSACLRTLDGFADEVLVVDTGSTDATAEIADDHGATVLHHPWEEDFAAARNLGLAAAAKDELDKAHSLFRKAIGARPTDQTLYRDLAEILVAADHRPDAVRLLETMPVEGLRRAEITVLLT